MPEARPRRLPAAFDVQKAPISICRSPAGERRRVAPAGGGARREGRGQHAGGASQGRKSGMCFVSSLSECAARELSEQPVRAPRGGVRSQLQPHRGCETSFLK